jgi:hypothetical protein
MNKCTNCEAELQDGVKFCSGCGTAVPSEPEPPIVDPAPPANPDKAGEYLSDAKKQRKLKQDALAENERLKEQIRQADLAKLDETERLKVELDEHKPFKEKAQAYESKMLALLDIEIEKIPEERKTLIPEGLNIADRLDWIVKNRSFLVGNTQAARPKASGAPPAGGNGPKPDRLHDGIEYESAVALVRNMPHMKGKSDEEINKKVVQLYGASSPRPDTAIVGDYPKADGAN